MTAMAMMMRYTLRQPGQPKLTLNMSFDLDDEGDHGDDDEDDNNCNGDDDDENFENEDDE